MVPNTRQPFRLDLAPVCIRKGGSTIHSNSPFLLALSSIGLSKVANPIFHDLLLSTH